MFGRKDKESGKVPFGEIKIAQVIPSEVPAAKGATLEFVDPDALFEVIKNKRSGILLRQMALHPLEEARLTYSLSQEGRLNLNCYLTFLSETSGQIDHIIADLLKKYYPSSNTLGGNRLIEGALGTKFIIGRLQWISNKKSILGINTGEGFDIDSKRVQVIPAPSFEPQSFANALSDFKQVFERVVNKSHLEVNRNVAQEEFKVEFPLSSREGAQELFGIAAALNVPEELVGKISIEKPKLTFADIGGQKEAKNSIRNLAKALEHPEIYKKWGTRTPRGILFFGPPGTGKTLLAKVLASQSEAVFLHVESSDVLTKWFGESEKLLKNVFELANSNGQKTIIFFDEIDALGVERGRFNDSTQTSYRLLSILLENLDGLSSNPDVTVVAATNRLETLDSALLRPGRFDVKIKVPNPDFEGRIEIFEIKLRQAEEIAERQLTNNLDIVRLARESENFSGAEVAEIVRRSLEEKAIFEAHGVNPGLVETLDILSQMDKYKRELVS